MNPFIPKEDSFYKDFMLFLFFIFFKTNKPSDLGILISSLLLSFAFMLRIVILLLLSQRNICFKCKFFCDVVVVVVVA